MDIKEHTNPDALEKYAFLWSEVRLPIAALALFLGGVPPVYYLLRIPGLIGIVGGGLTICWLISGLASLYLLYRWYVGGQKIFGKSDMQDMVAFFVLVVSGINLGLVGVTGSNIGMRISSNYIVFIIVGVLYLWAMWRLYSQWSKNGKKLF